MERNASAAEREWPVCQGMVPGARSGGAYLLLPAPETASDGLYCIGTDPADTAGRSGAGSKVERNLCKAPVDYEGRIFGNHGRRPVCTGSGLAGDAPC